MPTKITSKKGTLSQTLAPKKGVLKTRGAKSPVMAKPLLAERKPAPRIQTAEGWKREQFRKRAESVENE